MSILLAVGTWSHWADIDGDGRRERVCKERRGYGVQDCRPIGAVDEE